jgi:hypothetical protein
MPQENNHQCRDGGGGVGNSGERQAVIHQTPLPPLCAGDGLTPSTSFHSVHDDSRVGTGKGDIFIDSCGKPKAQNVSG